MKKLYALAVAAFAALSASAAAGDWHTVENFENNPATPGLFNLYGQDGSGTVTIETVATTDNADNHAAKFTGGDYNTGVLVTVTLPEGKTIADYKAIDFDVFNYNMTYKSIFVYVDGKAVREPDRNDIGGDGDKEAWKHFMYGLSATAAGSEVQIGIGFKVHGADAFAVDNIRLLERPAAEIELVGEPQINISHAIVAGAMTVTYSFDVTNYSGEEVKVTATLNGHEEVIFEEYLPEATDAPARAAGEIKRFGGTLKAHHDALRNLSNAQVTLTATAGKKQLFAVTEAPHTTTGIEDVTVDSAAAAEFYNLNGMRVDATQLAPGIYIRKTGDKAEKVFVK